MTVKVTKPAVNLREELADLRKPTGVAGEAMLRAETPQEQFQLIGAGRRNLVINGAMQVAQRGTSFTSAGTQYTLDRFKTEQGGIDNALINVTQDSDAPSGFAKSLKVTVATAETTVADNEYMGLVHLIEAQDLQQLDYNTAAAKSVTLSFWVKASVTGVYAVANYTADGSRIIGATYTINSANTWEYKTVTYAGDTAGQLDDNNGAGFYLYWYFAAGPDRKSSSNTSWGAYTGTKLAYGQEVQLIETVNATWQITGVQLELGKVATPFEHRSYGEELAACQRYFCRPISNVDEDGNSNVHNAIGVGRGAGGGTVIVWSLLTPVPLRDRPEITSSGSYYLTDGTSRTSATPTVVVISHFTVNGSNLLAHYTFSSSVCDDDRVVMVGGHTAVKIDLDAEL